MAVLRALYPIACVAGLKRGRGRGRRGRGNLGAREPVGHARARMVSRPNSLPLPFRTPATQAIYPTVLTLRPKGKFKTPIHIK